MKKKLKTQQKNDLKKIKPVSKKIYTYLIITGIVFLALILSYGWYCLIYQNKIFANVKIGEIEFSGLSKENALGLLKNKTKDSEDSQIVLSLNNQTWQIEPNNINLEYKYKHTIDKLYSIGRQKGFYGNLKERLSLFVTPRYLDAIYQFDQTNLNNSLSRIYKEVEKPISDAKFQYENGEIKIIPEQNGTQIDKAKVYNDLDKVFSTLSSPDIDLVLEDSYPKITQEKLEQIKNQYKKALEDDIVLDSELKNIIIDKSQIASWFYTVAVYIDKNQVKSDFKVHAADSSNFEAKLELNQEDIRQYISNIASEVNKDPKDARLNFSNGSVSIFQFSEKGYNLNQDETVTKITNLILSRINVAGITSDNQQTKSSNHLDLPLKVTEPDVSDTNINGLGIKEMIGNGSTSFYGSPKNRIYNINHGANMFQGVVMKPGDTLSAVSIIGNPSAESGYLPELVIKENKTIPEYGGGLCQVSTTLFRAALNAGLEILERTNHAYRVSYYEPPVGMDATVYYPSPDLVIRNNTPTHILIQASVAGTKITFSFYGTRDGREVEISEPQIYDTVSPPKAKYIESSDLPKGTIKKQEGSHPGAKASFYYKVTKNEEILFERTFNSVYKAWQAIYLYGPGTDVPDQDGDEDKEDEKKDEDKKDAGGNSCSNECEEGWSECKNGGIRHCNQDGDCLKWSAVTNCPDGKTCSNNECVDEPKPSPSPTST